MDELAVGFTYDQPALTAAQVATAAGSWDAVATYERLVRRRCPTDARRRGRGGVGTGAGRGLRRRRTPRSSPGIDLGGVLVTIQPPRGFGADPIGTYHAPDLPPPHHYLAFYRWLTRRATTAAGAPTRSCTSASTARSSGCRARRWPCRAACFPDVAIGDVPFFYPFVVNDPGEGTQAKRRAHAVDHRPPPAAADPGRHLRRAGQARAAPRRPRPDRRRWTRPSCRRSGPRCGSCSSTPRSTGTSTSATRPPDDGAFDDVILHVDGYLCALKDAQIRGGLHVLGRRAPADAALVDTVLAITRLPQGGVPSLRATAAAELGVDPDARLAPTPTASRRTCRDRRRGASPRAGWDPASTTTRRCGGSPSGSCPTCAARPTRSPTCSPASPVATCRPGRAARRAAARAHVLPTGRNFYSVDPKAIPSPLSWEVGAALADRARRAPPRRDRHRARRRSASCCGARRRCAPTATTSPRHWPCSACARRGTTETPARHRPRGRPARRARPAARRRDAAHQRLLPRRLPARRRPPRRRRARWSPRSTSRPDQNPIARGRRRRRPPVGPAAGRLRLRDPAAASSSARGAPTTTSPRCTWRGPGSPTAATATARRRRTDDAPALRRDRGRGQEPGQPRARHLRLRRLPRRTTAGWSPPSGRSPGASPKAWFGDSADPANPKVRSLAEEAARVVRSRVLNPRWIDAMRRHGYKGAFELAATVDYLVRLRRHGPRRRGLDVRAGHRGVRRRPERCGSSSQQSNPWALRAIAERLLEAAEREHVGRPATAPADTLTDAVLEAEGWEESR